MTRVASRQTEAALRTRVLDALSAVYDPELDEPITSLRFVSSCDVTADGDVEVLLRLPTPQCAPNFAFLMAADARAAVRRPAGVRFGGVKLPGPFPGEHEHAPRGRDGRVERAVAAATADHDRES